MFSYTVACSCDIIFWRFDYFCVMCVNYVFDVGHATQAYFNAVSLKIVVSMKVLINQFWELISDIFWNVFAVWEICVDSSNIFSLDECLERRDSMDRGICFKIGGRWFDNLCIYVISLLGLQKGRYVALDRLKVTSK